MNRDIPFDEEAVCDGCGAPGAFDFMGDFYCAKCLSKPFFDEIEKGTQMSSLFDSAVYARRNNTPWATINLIRFLKDMCWNDDQNRNMSLSVHHRPDVASRFWWTINWTGADGERYEQSAQELDLCLWRAAEAELQIEERLEKNRGHANG